MIVVVYKQSYFERKRVESKDKRRIERLSWKVMVVIIEIDLRKCIVWVRLSKPAYPKSLPIR